MSMNPKAKKILKIVAWSLAGIVGFVILALLTIPLWIGPVVKGVANSTVPEITGTGFNMGEFGLNPYAGKVHVGDVQLQNPKRFFEREGKEEAKEGESLLDAGLRHGKNLMKAGGDLVWSPETNAFTLASLDVRMNTSSLLTDTLVIEEIAIKDIYLYGDLTFSNLREIVAKATENAKEKEEKEESATKVVIDRLEIAGVHIKWGALSVKLTDPIVLRDIGKEEVVTEEGLLDQVVTAVADAAEAVNSGLGVALKAAYTAGKTVGSGVADLTSGAVDAASGAVSGAVDAVKGLNPFGK